MPTETVLRIEAVCEVEAWCRSPGYGCRCVLAGGAMHPILCRLDNMSARIRKDLSVLLAVLVGMLWYTAW